MTNRRAPTEPSEVSPLQLPGARDERAGSTPLALQKEVAQQHAAYQKTAPPPPPQAAKPSPAAPTNGNAEAMLLQKEKEKLNQRLVERLKRHLKEKPNQDSQTLEEQIKKRENKWANSP